MCGRDLKVLLHLWFPDIPLQYWSSPELQAEAPEIAKN
jgi:hypothetical protein